MKNDSGNSSANVGMASPRNTMRSTVTACTKSSPMRMDAVDANRARPLHSFQRRLARRARPDD